MFGIKSKKINTILSVILIVLGLLMHFVLEDTLKRIDLEVVHFFAGFFFAIGFAGLFGAFNKSKKRA